MIGHHQDPEFSTRPFIAGTLTGLRCWRVDSFGRLLAMNQFPNPVWTPGENDAECHRQWAEDKYHLSWVSPTNISATYASLAAGGGLKWNTFDDRPPEMPPRVPVHDIADLECVCGFYAYFDTAANQYAQADSIYGLIEGYGLVSAGERGFRASKARIKALVLPKTNQTATAMRVAVNYGDIPIFSTIEAMVKKHPLALPSDVPTPDSIPDFWTRSA